MDDLLEYVDSIEMEDFEQIYEFKRCMVRANFAIYSTIKDVNALISALNEIGITKNYY